MHVLRPTGLTWVASALIAFAIAASGVYLAMQYPTLPDLLAVHFGPRHAANGWQFKTWLRVLLPVIIQVALGSVSFVIAALLLCRSHRPLTPGADVVAAQVAAEAVVLFASIWVVFQAYAARALVEMWRRETGGLGLGYTLLINAGILLSVGVAARAQMRFGRPEYRPDVPEHWRFGQLYRNPSDPALFVPTRDGKRWTLNFGRPAAAVLMAITLAVGIIVPFTVLRILLR